MRIVNGLVLAALVGALAGCGSSRPPAAATTSRTGQVAAAFHYAQCIRAHGVPNFPDPHVSTSPGRTSISQQALAESPAVAGRFKTAQRACRGILAAIENDAAAQQKARAGVFLAFARCLRGHGEANFPDPNHGGQITPQMLTAAGVDLRAPQFLSAAKACIGLTHGAITAGDIRAAISGRH